MIDYDVNYDDLDGVDYAEEIEQIAEDRRIRYEYQIEQELYDLYY